MATPTPTKKECLVNKNFPQRNLFGFSLSKGKIKGPTPGGLFFLYTSKTPKSPLTSPFYFVLF